MRGCTWEWLFKRGATKSGIKTQFVSWGPWPFIFIVQRRWFLLSASQVSCLGLWPSLYTGLRWTTRLWAHPSAGSWEPPRVGRKKGGVGSGKWHFGHSSVDAYENDIAIFQWETPSRMWHYPWWSWPSCVPQLAMCWQGEADRDCGKRMETTPILIHLLFSLRLLCLSIRDSRWLLSKTAILNVSLSTYSCHQATRVIIFLVRPPSAVSGWGNIPGYLPLLPHANQAEVCSPSAYASPAETTTQSPAEGWCLGGSCSRPGPLAKKLCTVS